MGCCCDLVQRKARCCTITICVRTARRETCQVLRIMEGCAVQFHTILRTYHHISLLNETSRAEVQKYVPQYQARQGKGQRRNASKPTKPSDATVQASIPGRVTAGHQQQHFPLVQYPSPSVRVWDTTAPTPEIPMPRAPCPPRHHCQ